MTNNQLTTPESLIREIISKIQKHDDVSGVNTIALSDDDSVEISAGAQSGVHSVFRVNHLSKERTVVWALIRYKPGSGELAIGRSEISKADKAKVGNKGAEDLASVRALSSAFELLPNSLFKGSRNLKEEVSKLSEGLKAIASSPLVKEIQVHAEATEAAETAQPESAKAPAPISETEKILEEQGVTEPPPKEKPKPKRKPPKKGKKVETEAEAKPEEKELSAAGKKKIETARLINQYREEYSEVTGEKAVTFPEKDALLYDQDGLDSVLKTDKKRHETLKAQKAKEAETKAEDQEKEEGEVVSLEEHRTAEAAEEEFEVGHLSDDPQALMDEAKRLMKKLVAALDGDKLKAREVWMMPAGPGAIKGLQTAEELKPRVAKARLLWRKVELGVLIASVNKDIKDLRPDYTGLEVEDPWAYPVQWLEHQFKELEAKLNDARATNTVNKASDSAEPFDDADIPF